MVARCLNPLVDDKRRDLRSFTDDEGAIDCLLVVFAINILESRIFHRFERIDICLLN